MSRRRRSIVRSRRSPAEVLDQRDMSVPLDRGGQTPADWRRTWDDAMRVVEPRRGDRR